MSFYALRTQRLKTLALYTVIVAGLVSVNVAEELDRFQLYSCIGVG